MPGQKLRKLYVIHFPHSEDKVNENLSGLLSVLHSNTSQKNSTTNDSLQKDANVYVLIKTDDLKPKALKIR